MKPEDYIRLASDLDPIRKGKREALGFNGAWLKRGEQLTLAQRVGFSVISLFFLFAGIYALTNVAADMFQQGWELLGTIWDLCLAALFTIVFILPGVFGLRNVLRFPRKA